MSAIQKRLSNMEVRFDESEVIVIDMGSGFIKAGYSGEDLPRVVIPTVIGERENTVEDGSTQNNDGKPNKVYSKKVGNEAFAHRSDHELFHPVNRGIVTDWNRFTELLEYVFESELQVNSNQATVLMTDCPMSRKEDKHRMAQIMFEQFKVKAFALQNTAALSLFSTGTTTGLVAESGEGVTYTVPVFEGYALPHAMQTINVAGQELTNKLIAELQESEIPVDESHYHLIRDVKERMCHVAMNYESEKERRDDDLSVEDRSYELPNGEIIEVSQRKRIAAAETIFEPYNMIGVEHPEFGDRGGIANLAFRSIEKCDSDLKI